MNYEMLREIVRLKRGPLSLVALFLLASVAIWGYASLRQEPALKSAEEELSRTRALARGPAGTPASRYRAAQDELQLFRTRVLDKRSFPGLLSRLFDTAQRNSLALKQVSYKPTPVLSESLLSYEVGFTVSGKYPQVKSFIAELARFPEMVTLDSVALMNPSPIEEHVDLRMQITAYLKREGA